MKKEVNGTEAIYLIVIFIMPIVTMIGLTLLEQEVLNMSNVIEVGVNDIYRIFLDEIILFLVCWIGLFISYILYKYNIRVAQIVLIFASIIFLVLNAYATVTRYASIAEIINPVILLSASVYSVFKPLPKEVTDNRKERTKNSIKKVVKNKKTNK